MPASPKPPACGFALPGRAACRKRGDHFCLARVHHVVQFFATLLTHTTGDWAKRPFTPADWQVRDVLAPLFGQVVYDEWRGRYIRRYRILYLSIARKNGKTELAAGIILYLLAADGEWAAEIYGLALDMGQAALVYRAAKRMVMNSPVLSEYLQVVDGAQRIIYPETDSFYAVAAADAPGNLGENPSGACIDELLTQPDRELYDAMRTGMGARAQPLLLLVTTAENDPASFAASERAFSERVAEDPSLDPERLVVIKRADPTDDWTLPATWRKANPALGDYLEVRTLASECTTALNNPTAARSFRQFRLNEPVDRMGRAIARPAWIESAGPITAAELPAHLAGRECFGGMDLATTQDLAAYCLVFPAERGVDVIWRHFAPAWRISEIGKNTGGQPPLWVARGELTLTDSPVTDYETIKTQLDHDRQAFRIREMAFDPWNAVQLAMELSDAGWTMVPMGQTARAVSAATSELLRLVAAGTFRHGGSGIMGWQAGNAVTRIDANGNVRFARDKSADKIDGLASAVMALDRALRRAPRAEDYAAAGF